MSDAVVTPEHLSEAADWHLRLNDGSPSDVDRRAWQDWYDRSDEHRAAWQRVERLQQLLAHTPPQARRALSQMPETLERPERRSSAARPAPRKTDRRRALTGLGALGAVVMGGFFYRAWTPAAAPVEWVATRAGQRRELTLPDGSHVLLGPNTRLGIDYSPARRTLHLAQGAVQLETAPDHRHRPITLLSRDGEVTPLGTRLTLAQEDQATVVAVQAHAVSVLPTGATFPSRVNAGQRLRFFPGGHDPVGVAGFADEAWTRGMLVVMDQPLAQVLQTLQTQSGMALSCDASIAGLRISGSFITADPQRSLATVADQWGLRLERQGQGWVLRPR
ncbi:DUF4880 domain-containing protein [Roseateles sp. SL47]|uniref:FecR domain-containing protein n=1 Tax=Roseateles sp. SL47 TaxID=2995138 RepID=UPI00227213F2|nr:FecR domain-containing protein [Roseateles sp. SL47]WAC72005.1 DUF4880 domain-containing protein [Roseateles sp. SL47]